MAWQQPHPSSQAVCLNMQPYDAKEAEPLSGQEARVLAAQKHPDFVLWSISSFAFLNCCCLGFAALVFSIKSRDRKVIGDPEGAASYGKTAKCLNITHLLASLIFFICIIIVIVYNPEPFVALYQQMKQHQ